MKRLHTSLLLALFILVCCSQAFSASNMPKGVQSFAPTGTVPDNVSFRIVFRNPVVTKAQTGKTFTPENSHFPFEVNPPLNLEGRWQNERTFTAKLLAPLQQATSYSATLRDGLKDRRGNSIGPGTFRFQTEGLSPTDIKASMGRDGNAYFTLAFNMRVDPARLKGYMRILDQQGKELPYSINGALPSRTIRASVPVQKSSSRQRFTVHISAGLKSGEGDLGINNDYTESVVLDPQLMVRELSPERNAIRAYFNFGIDPNTAKSFITIEPAVSDVTFSSGWSDENFTIRSENFRPRDRFVITFRKGFPSKGGLVLKEDYKQSIIMPDLAPDITLPSTGTYLTALNDGLIPIELLNIKKLQLDLWRMYENNIPYMLHDDYDEFDKDIARRVFTKEIPLSLPLNKTVRKSIPVNELAQGKRGLFLLTARDANADWWDEYRQIISLSDLGVTARLWEDAILLWVNSLTSAKGVNEADVKIYSSAKQLLASGKTNSAGVFYYQIPDGNTWERDNQPYVAVVRKGSGENADLTYLQLTSDLLNREIFDTSGRAWLFGERSGYDGAIISPRDIYRTGETAHFKAIIRNPDITIPKAFPIVFTVKDTLGRKVTQQAVTLNDKGSALFELGIPANALTGVWTVNAAVPGAEDRPIAAYKFHVEDFAPPRIEVKLNTLRKYLVKGDTFTADIYARWLFGVDGAGLPYKVSWVARAGEFTPTQERWKAYTFGDSSRVFEREEGELEGGQLDAFGKATANLPVNADWQAATTVNVTLKVEVMEDGGRWITGTMTRKYYPSGYLLGIAPENDSFSVGNAARFRVAGITPEEEPANPGDLTATLYRVTWNYNMIEIDGRKRWQSTEELTEIEDKSFTLKNGLGNVAFTPKEWGSYLVRVSDADDNARAVYRFYATDPKYAGRGSQLIDRIDMSTEKDTYKVGETAQVKIKAPFAGLMLITVENAKLIDRNIRIVEDGEVTFDVPITKDMMPNAWVSAWLIRPVEGSDAKQWASHRAIGLLRLKTDLSSYSMNVAIDAPKKIEPASKLPVKISLTGAGANLAGNADVAIAFVDDGVLGLTRYKTPDLLNHFWGLKTLNSKGFDLYDQLIPIEDQATEQLHPGGDEAMGALALDGNIQRFKILSLFDGVLEADNNGVITTELDIPEFSGRGRLYVVAASGKSFGKAEQTIEIARDVVTEAGLPRFAAPGDEFLVPISVFNTSGQNKEITIQLTPEGLTLDESYSLLKIPAGAKGSFTTKARALGGANKAVLKITTSWHGVSYTQEIDIPIRSAWPSVTTGATGSFANGTTKITVPTDDFMGEISGTLTLANTPAVNINRAVQYLNAYPHACLEQTISTAWPFLILPDAVAELDPLIANDNAIHERTEGAINRIQSMQLYDGSFAAWPGTSTPYHWGSVYAAHFLLAAKNAGVSFPEEMLTGALNWMRGYMASMYTGQFADEQDDMTTKAYATYVLALNGERPLGWIEYVRENAGLLKPSGHVYLAGAQSLVDGNADALRSLHLGRHTGYSGRTLESETRNVAVLLGMWLDVEPQAPEVTELAQRLAELGSNGSWYSTQDNASAIVALARYNVEAAGAKSDIHARVTTETSDKALLTYDNQTASIRIDELPKGSDILIEAEGTGQGCYSWSITGFPKRQPKPERKNVNVECVYFDAKGNVVDLRNPIAHGSVIQCVLTVKPSMTVNSLSVNYLLPAGFEIETPRLEDGAENQAGTYGIVSDVRDDRLVLFIDRLSGERSYGFKMRAVTRGKFRMPQVSAYGMYDAGVRYTGNVQPDVEIK